MKKLLLTLSMVVITIIATAQVSITVNVPTAGGFSTALVAAGGDANTVTDLTVTGNIDCRDIYYMRNLMPVLSVLDIESAQIKAFNASPENTLPSQSFDQKTTLKSIKLPNSITSIGEAAFWGCKGLTGSLTIPNSVTSIENHAFQGCTGLNGNLTLPNSITSLGTDVFYGCSGITGNLILPNSITSIGDYTFYLCKGITGNLIIPNSVTSIGDYAFSECSGFNGNLTIPNSVTSIGNLAFYNCTGFTGSLTIPNSVVSIGYWAFCNCSGFNGSLTISNAISSIGALTFNGCHSFTGNLTIPSSVTSIGFDAFYYCSGFSGSLNIPNSVTYIGDGAFSGGLYKLTSLTIPSSVDSIGSTAFYSCSGLSKITVALAVPPIITASTFTYISKSSCQLIVPLGSKTAYQTTIYWKDFLNISEAILVTFNTAGGSAVPDLMLPVSSTIIQPVEPTKKGYTFAGWFKETTCTNPWNFATDMITTNTSLYAKWNINSYTVSFDSQGGSVLSDISAIYNTNIAIPLSPTQTGYTFAGWYKEAACLNVWDFATDKVIANTTLYAKWTINSYTVSFNSQGGNTIANINANYKTSIAQPTVPTQPGYSFAGWYKELGCTDKWNFTTDLVVANTTLYAKWIINNYTITYESNGGSIVSNINADYNTKIAMPSQPTKNNFTFGGWYKDPAFANSWNFSMDVVKTNTTLYAKWMVTINFSVDNGSIINDIITNCNTTIATPTQPVRSGYTFAGWFKESAFTNSWNFATDVVYTNTTLYAKWNINNYTVTFNSQGGSAISNITTNYNTSIAAPIAPNLTGYTFAGWYKDAACTSVWNFASDMVTTNTTLYAKWMINSYTVRFMQGHTIVATQTASYIATITAPANPIIDGYTFAGWNNADLTKTWNFATDKVTSDTILFAKWMVTISYNVNGGSQVNDALININTLVTEPAAPSKTGFTFAGWYKDSNFTNAWAFTTDLAITNITLYAKWTINVYTVNFNTNGGNALGDITTNYNTTVAAPNAPSKTGYTFAGWYKDAAFTNAWVFNSDLVTTNTTLYAKWTSISNGVPTSSIKCVKLYPNPAEDIVTLEGNNMEHATIFSLSGIIVMQVNLQEKNLNKISISELKSGNYLVYIKMKGGNVSIINLLKR